MEALSRSAVAYAHWAEFHSQVLMAYAQLPGLLLLARDGTQDRSHTLRLARVLKCRLFLLEPLVEEVQELHSYMFRSNDSCPATDRSSCSGYGEALELSQLLCLFWRLCMIANAIVSGLSHAADPPSEALPHRQIVFARRICDVLGSISFGGDWVPFSAWFMLTNLPLAISVFAKDAATHTGSMIRAMQLRDLYRNVRSAVPHTVRLVNDQYLDALTPWIQFRGEQPDTSLVQIAVF
jgi:hypothetical protein